MKLTDTACKNAKPSAKQYKLYDGAGLSLLITAKGQKYWRLKYSFHGKEKSLALGVYPLISLADARDAAYKARKMIAHGTDPAMLKKHEKRLTIRNAQNTFKAVALEWHENQKGRWSDNHYNNVLHRLEADIFPVIGAMSICDIEAPDLLDALRRIEKRGALDLAGRSRQICGQVFRYGIQTGRCKRDPSSDLKGALRSRKTKHFAAIDTKEI